MTTGADEVRDYWRRLARVEEREALRKGDGA